MPGIGENGRWTCAFSVVADAPLTSALRFPFLPMAAGVVRVGTCRGSPPSGSPCLPPARRNQLRPSFEVELAPTSVDALRSSTWNPECNHWICCRKSASSHLGNLPGNQPNDLVKETRNIVFLTMCCAAQNTSPDPRQRPPPRPQTPHPSNPKPRPTQRPRPQRPGTPRNGRDGTETHPKTETPWTRDPRDPGPTQRPRPQRPGTPETHPKTTPLKTRVSGVSVFGWVCEGRVSGVSVVEFVQLNSSFELKQVSR